VLNPGYEHYGHELRLVATSSRRLVEKLLTLDLRMGATVLPLRPIAGGAVQDAQRPGRQTMTERWDLMPAEPVKAWPANCWPTAICWRAGRSCHRADGGGRGRCAAGADDRRGSDADSRQSGEKCRRGDARGRPHRSEAAGNLRRRPLERGSMEVARWMAAADGGRRRPGIPKKSLEKIFDSGYSTRTRASERLTGWTAAHRGLGLSITRSIVEAAGGSIHAAARAPAGACFTIELPVQSR